jgi:hypothetical protein
MTYDPKAVDELLDKIKRCETEWDYDCGRSDVEEIFNIAKSLRPPKKYYTMPTFEEAAKLAGIEIGTSNAGERRFTLQGCFIWERVYNALRELTATDKPPGKIPAGKDLSIHDVMELRLLHDDTSNPYGGLRAVIDAIKEKYGV